ncbi:MAG: 4Fe-4S dicluster domain-containing protein [Candidatus Margulisbacteria bacterium]|nr:4Fe-4S dicluster domain-containing protein [Candidatus Margulisiibacteriota bacterium]
MKKTHIATLKKERFDDFISALARLQKVVAPVARGNGQFAFEPVVSGNEIALDYIPTILPPKKYFLPQHETLATFDTTKGQQMEPVVAYEKMVIFGVHTCDLAGIQSLNMIFSERPKDVNYLIRKSAITIIGYECNDYCDEYASCRLVHNHTPNGGYDLFFTNLGDKFIIHINTQAGDDIIESAGLFEPAQAADLKALEQLRSDKRKLFANEVPVVHENIPEVFAKSFNSKVWEDLGKKCLACGNCTNVCPTCYCFDVIDEPNLDLKTGKRYRRWDSCQSETFAQVAGGESFREERGARQRHRFYRKFKYPMNKFSRLFCTGCGRCSRTCMAKINLKETLTQLVKEQAMTDLKAGNQ